MKKISLLLILLSVSFTINSFGDQQATSNKNTSKVLLSPAVMEATYGEKVTTFTISPDESGGKIDYKRNSELQSTKKISKENFNYLMDSITKLHGISNDVKSCPRSYISTTTQNKKLLACLGSKNKLAQDMQKMSNLISILF